MLFEIHVFIIGILSIIIGHYFWVAHLYTCVFYFLQLAGSTNIRARCLPIVIIPFHVVFNHMFNLYIYMHFAILLFHYWIIIDQEAILGEHHICKRDCDPPRVTRSNWVNNYIVRSCRFVIIITNSVWRKTNKA